MSPFLIIDNQLNDINFPYEECRALVLFDIPTVAHIQERFN